MEASPLRVEKTLNAPIGLVWKAFTDKAEMKKWYFDMNAFEAKVGFEFQFIGTDGDCNEYIHLCKILEVIPYKKLVHTWSYKGFEGESILTLEFFEEGVNTRIVLTHAGLESFPSGHKAFAKSNFEAGWAEIIGINLPNYLQQNV